MYNKTIKPYMYVMADEADDEAVIHYPVPSTMTFDVLTWDVDKGCIAAVNIHGGNPTRNPFDRYTLSNILYLNSREANVFMTRVLRVTEIHYDARDVVSKVGFSPEHKHTKALSPYSEFHVVPIAVNIGAHGRIIECTPDWLRARLIKATKQFSGDKDKEWKLGEDYL